jgi:hypothetical protein
LAVNTAPARTWRRGRCSAWARGGLGRACAVALLASTERDFTGGLRDEYAFRLQYLTLGDSERAKADLDALVRRLVRYATHEQTATA